MTAPLPPNLTAKQRRLILAYRNLDLTVADILRLCDATRDELYAALRKGREPFRRPASAKASRVARQGIGLSNAELLGLAGPSLEPVAEASLGRRLERLLLARIADLEDRVAPGRGADPELAARALALNVRTLATLRRAEPVQDDAPFHEDQPPARSLATLRDELLGHLERIRGEERARRGLPPPGHQRG